MITNKNLILIIDILRKVFSPASVPFNRQAAVRAGQFLRWNRTNQPQNFPFLRITPMVK